MIRFFNGRTLTMADGVSVTTDEVWTDGDKIAYIGPAPETLPAFERQIDLGGDLVMPGFKNAHAHAGMSFVRSYADDVPLQPWLFEQIFPLEAKLTPEAVYAFTRSHDFRLILAYHTQGEVIYWKYLDYEPAHSYEIAQYFGRVSGYTVEETPTQSGYAGYKDWFIQEYDRPGYTIEAGMGENPLPMSDFAGIYRDNAGILLGGMTQI